jgi:hypothetical protein
MDGTVGCLSALVLTVYPLVSVQLDMVPSPPWLHLEVNFNIFSLRLALESWHDLV